MSNERERIFNQFVNDRWPEQLATFEDKLERALNNALDEAFDYAWDYQEKKIERIRQELIKMNNNITVV